MSKCSKYEEIISAYVDGELTSAEESELTAHLDNCAQCRSLLETYRNIDKLISDNTVEPPAELLQNVMAGISGLNAGWSTSKKSIRRVAVRYLAVAACIALTILAVPRVLGGSNSIMSASLTADSDSVEYVTTYGTEKSADAANPEKEECLSDSSAAVGSSSGTIDSDTAEEDFTAVTSKSGAADGNDDTTAAVSGVAGAESAAQTDGGTKSSLTGSVVNTAPAFGLTAPQTDSENGSDAGVTSGSGAISGTVSDTGSAANTNSNYIETGYQSSSDLSSQLSDVLFTDSKYAGIITVIGALPKVLNSSELYVNGNGIYRIYVDKYTALDLVRTGYDFTLNDKPMSEEFVVIYTH